MPRKPSSTASAAAPRRGRLAAPDAAAFPRRALLAWYDRQRRSMPWRGEHDPYRVWLSEVMLQQTQVATATPYYRSFLERFPTLESLARAREPDVLAAWAGLGYYRRARHLREAARLVVRDHGGHVPSDPGAFAALPGVGRYTVGAVLSIAFDRPLPALDGNVARVLSRLFALHATVREPRGARALWSLAGTLVPMRRPGDWNQALMELGATVCTPRAPRCGECPVRRACRARSLGSVGELPPVAARRAGEKVRRAAVLVARGRRLLMARREGALLGGLWEPPGVDLPAGGHAPAAARRALAALLAELGVRARLARTGHTVRHVITHRDIEVEVWRGDLLAPPRRSARRRWVDAGRPVVALTALARKLAAVPRAR